jgi:hypothetical protein
VVHAFAKRKSKRPASQLESSTLKGFGGGWNTIDDDLSMSPNYQVTLLNFHRTTSGSQAVRFGQHFTCDIAAVHNSPIIDGYYFNARNVVVTLDGHVLTVDQSGLIITEIWSPAVAAALPGTGIPWGPQPIEGVSFVPFKDTLIIHNGKDKPIVIASDFTVTYLNDLATGSVVNVPVGRFGCVASNYHCIADIAVTTGGGVVTKRFKTQIYISSKGTAGVFPGDPTPNDSISIDVGAYAPEGAAAIRGIAGFRTYLLVFLQNITLQIKLGVYDSSNNHTPQFPDTLPQFGLLGHRTIITVENDIMFCGLSGLASARRNLYAPDTVMSDYLSTQIDPSYRRIAGSLTDDEQQFQSFTVFDKLSNDFLLFMPGGRVLCYTFNSRLKMHAWSSFENMDWTAGWSTVLGRMYLVSGTKIFQSGNSTYNNENYYSDKIMDRDIVFSSADATAFVTNTLYYDSVTGEVWKCTISHPKTAGLTFDLERTNNPSMWVLYEGNPIPIEFELPWIDGKDPVKLKQLRYLSIATKGDAEFTFDAYVDNLYKDVDGNVIYAPCVSMTFIGNDAYGFGFDDGPYGMGRRSRDPRLYAVPLKFKTIKFKIWGLVNKKLELVNLSFLYARNRTQGYVR